MLNNPYYDESEYIKSINNIDERQFREEFINIKSKLKAFGSDIDFEFYEKKLKSIEEQKTNKKINKKINLKLLNL